MYDTYNGKTVDVVRANGNVAFSSTVDLSLNEFKAMAEMCNNTGIDPKMVLAIMAHESNFQSDAYNSSSGASGYMQVLEKYYSANLTANSSLLSIAKNYSGLSESALKNDALNPYGNMAAGINALSTWKNQYGETDMLKAYATGNKPASGWSQWAKDMDWEFRNIMSQL